MYSILANLRDHMVFLWPTTITFNRLLVGIFGKYIVPMSLRKRPSLMRGKIIILLRADISFFHILNPPNYAHTKSHACEYHSHPHNHSNISGSRVTDLIHFILLVSLDSNCYTSGASKTNIQLAMLIFPPTTTFALFMLAFCTCANLRSDYLSALSITI